MGCCTVTAQNFAPEAFVMSWVFAWEGVKLVSILLVPQRTQLSLYISLEFAKTE